MKNIIIKNKHVIKSANKKSFPAFLGDIESSVPSNSSPYICKISDLLNFNKDNEIKKKLLISLEGLIDEINISIGEPVAALVGGSFLVKGVVRPNDIDALIFYKENSRTLHIVKGTIDRIKKTAIEGGVDLKLCPYDYNPLFTIKMCSFYTHLYMSSKSGQQNKGCLLIDLAGIYDYSSPEIMARTVWVNWDGGDVNDPTFPANVIGI